MYVGNLVTALGCIDAGITCIIDNSNNARSPEHSDAAIRRSSIPAFAPFTRQDRRRPESGPTNGRKISPGSSGGTLAQAISS
jgi:hypothetical protein